MVARINSRWTSSCLFGVESFSSVSSAGVLIQYSSSVVGSDTGVSDPGRRLLHATTEPRRKTINIRVIIPLTISYPETRFRSSSAGLQPYGSDAMKGFRERRKARPHCRKRRNPAPDMAVRRRRKMRVSKAFMESSRQIGLWIDTMRLFGLILPKR